MRAGLKVLFITVPLALAGAGFLAYVVANKPPPQRITLSERATPVRVIVTRTQDVTPQIKGYGLVKPAHTYEAIAQVAGTAEYVNPALQKGAILPAGTVLLRLSPTDFNLAIAQANANIRAAQARLAELSVSETNLAAALVIEQEALALKEKDLTRAQSLFSAGSVAQTTLDNARSGHLAQRQKVQNVQSSLALLPTQHAVQTEQIAVYQASLDTARLNLERTELTLPFTARVAAVSVEVGQFVRAGATTAVLDGVKAAEVAAQVSVADLRKLIRLARAQNMENTKTTPPLMDLSSLTQVLRDLGLTARVRLRLGDDFLDWPGTVDRISDTIDQKTGTIGVIVSIASAYSSATPGNRPPLTKGMFVQVTLNGPPITGIVVPRNAVRDAQVLLADKDNRLKIAPVETRLVQNDIAIIGSGLKIPARVVVSTLAPAIAGMLLEVTQDSDLMARLARAGQAGQPE